MQLTNFSHFVQDHEYASQEVSSAQISHQVSTHPKNAVNWQPHTINFFRGHHIRSLFVSCLIFGIYRQEGETPCKQEHLTLRGRKNWGWCWTIERRTMYGAITTTSCSLLKCEYRGKYSNPSLTREWFLRSSEFLGRRIWVASSDKPWDQWRW